MVTGTSASSRAVESPSSAGSATSRTIPSRSESTTTAVGTASASSTGRNRNSCTWESGCTTRRTASASRFGWDQISPKKLSTLGTSSTKKEKAWAKPSGTWTRIQTRTPGSRKTHT